MTTTLHTVLEPVQCPQLQFRIADGSVVSDRRTLSVAVIQAVVVLNVLVLLVQDAMLQLWCHETFRIIGDRMWDPVDRTWLKGQLDDKLKTIFGTSWDELFGEGKDCPPFVSFMRNSENPPYEPVTDLVALKVFCIHISNCFTSISVHFSVTLVPDCACSHI